jgi:hypothetical protein
MTALNIIAWVICALLGAAIMFDFIRTEKNKDWKQSSADKENGNESEDQITD